MGSGWHRNIVHARGAQRIDHCIDDRGACADGPRFAATLYAERIVRAWRVLVGGDRKGRNIVRAGQAIVVERPGDELSLVVSRLLSGRQYD